MALNSISIMGRLTADPELRQTNDGTPVLSFRIAVPKSTRRNSAEGPREANFFPCVAWRGTAENIAKFFKKGQRIALTGSLQSREYVTKEGANRVDTEIIVDSFEFVEPREATASRPAQAMTSASPQEIFGTYTPTDSDIADPVELPF